MFSEIFFLNKIRNSENEKSRILTSGREKKGRINRPLQFGFLFLSNSAQPLL